MRPTDLWGLHGTDVMVVGGQYGKVHPSRPALFLGMDEYSSEGLSPSLSRRGGSIRVYGRFAPKVSESDLLTFRACMALTLWL